MSKISKTHLENLQSHPEVREKPWDVHPNIVSFNFSRKVFFKKAWDDIVVKARGLFVDLSNDEIVARGYDKFFNIGERPETQTRSLCDNLKFPIEVWKKENGFLGILGVFDNNGKKELFFSSKSSPSSDFTKYFKDLFYEKTSEEDRERILDILIEYDVCAVFEVVDIENDPHIIEYKESELYLLDIFSRTDELKLNRLYFPHFVGNSQIKPKELEDIFEDWQSFHDWYKEVTTDESIKHEGYVIVDQNLFMTKIKLPYYNFWKYMRSLRDQIKRKRKGSKKVFDKTQLNKEQLNFYEWMENLADDDLEEDIISLRKKFYAK